jgi:hypothetical protein
MMDSLAIEARKASADPRDCREAMNTLRFMGFGEDEFRLLHHQHGSAARFYRYCESVQQFVEYGNNHRVHQRLTYVLLSCPAGALPEGKSFQALAEEAFRLILPIV